MSKVKILPPEIVSKIAAGEVVERPASVLKELVENSVDAQATSIEVTLKGAGKTLIQIKDNGTGIPRDDITTLFNRHATSKIANLDDLYHIISLGFRGEALYSIGAIADIILRSKTKTQDCGWEAHVRGNARLSQKPVTMHNGTEIEVQELFFNTPARKKFMKSNTSELNAILDIFIPYTLLYPSIRFSLTHEERKIIDLPKSDTLIPRAAKTLHLEEKYILEEKRDLQDSSLHLVLGDINIQRTRKNMQFIFINNRPVQNKTIGFHINDIYRHLFSHGVYPFFCVYITMPPQELDVNVHPTKREVKIRNEAELAPILRSFAESLLMTKSKAKQFGKNVSTAAGQKADFPHSRKYDFQTPHFAELKASLTHPQATLSIEKNRLLFQNEIPALTKEDTLKQKLGQSRFLGSLLNKYLLFQTGDSLLVIDQHAAHERINFEKLKSQIEKGDIETQQLLAPILLKVSQQEILAWEENQEILEKTGFSCGLFDKETLAVHAHPQLITHPENSVRNLLAGERIDKLDAETLARMACRSSITTGYSLNKEEAEYQRSQLLLCQAPFTCPHGRPTLIEITDDSLSKQFLRK